MVYGYAILLSMAARISKKLNLEHELPEGLLVDAAWLGQRGYSTSLRSQYVAAGWLEQPARSVYRRPRGPLNWQQTVISLQSLLECPLVVGGRTALELQGYAHYLSRSMQEVHLYGPHRPPSWLSHLPVSVRFLYHNDRKLFRTEHGNHKFGTLLWNPATGQSAGSDPAQAPAVKSQGQWDWPLILSIPERAVLELLDELPTRESFEQVDKLMGSATNLSPSRLQDLLADCRNVKVKRLFFFFADRHAHPWLKRIDKAKVDLGKGKRMLTKGGKLDNTYQITVPEDLDAVQ